jgi:hypothetical protein
VQHRPPVGPRPIIGRPYRLRFRDVHIKKPAPRFGEDNRRILGELLGLDAGQIEALFQAGIVCDRPTKPGQAAPLNTEAMLRSGTLVAFDADYRSRLGLD